MIISELFESPQQCPECGGISFSDLILAEKKDACYHKVKASAKVWPSAYASGRLVQCRKKGAGNYGNKSEGVAEDWKGDLGVQGYAVGGPIGGLVGGAVGELTKEEQLNEFAPLLAAGARLVIAMAPKIAQVLKNTGKATAKAAAPVAKSGAEVAAKNAGQIGVGLGAYEIGSSVADIAKDITAKVGTALEEQTVMELAQVAFKFAIPAGIVLAILYGGKKVIDSLFSDSKTEQGMAESQLTANTPNPVVVIQDLKGKILDTVNLSVAVQKYKLGNPQDIKKQLAHQNYTTIGNYVVVAPMGGQPQDQTTLGQKSTFTATEGEQQPGADYRDPKEVDYDDQYDSMVARVKKLAGLGPMDTVYDPAKRQYRNMPTAVQPPKK
jgi:hypothetical protein